MVARLTPESAAQHPHRAALLTVVRAEPGIGFRELCSRSGIAAGTTHYHLAVLERFGQLRSERVGSVALAFMPSDDARSGSRLSLLREPGMGDIIELVRRHGRIRQSDILDALGQWPRSTVQHRLQRLTVGGVLQRTWHGRFCFYEVAA